MATGTVQKAETIPIRSSSDVVMVRQRVRVLAIEMKFSLVEQTKIVTAASELGRNTLEHGGGGSLELAVITNGARRGIHLRFIDHGPGMADVALALKSGNFGAPDFFLRAWTKLS